MQSFSNKLRKVLRKTPVVALPTGAGVSAESGISILMAAAGCQVMLEEDWS
ncbi:MAG: hypothetical protein J7M32_04805 [Deltaproteobacteria bacterium]|nr:hypothetical protein [Deltaproteobacteria bacterium]